MIKAKEALAHFAWLGRGPDGDSGTSTVLGVDKVPSGTFTSEAFIDATVEWIVANNQVCFPPTFISDPDVHY